MWWYRDVKGERITALLQAILKRLIRLETKVHKVAEAQGIKLELKESEAVEKELLTGCGGTG